MFEEPTLDDFAAWIDFHLRKALDEAKRRVGKIKVERASRGIVRSSSTISATFEAVHSEFDHGVDAALGELKRATRITKLDKHALRAITEDRLRTFALEIKVVTEADQMRKWGGPVNMINQSLSEFDSKLEFALRQFAVGLLDPLEPEVPLSMTNSINIGVMSGGAVQQGSPHATQNISMTFNIEAVKSAVAEFEKAVGAASAETVAEMKPDLDTIKAQLDKKAPGETIIKEAGKSLRSIIEGAAAGALSPHIVTAARALWTALGLG